MVGPKLKQLREARGLTQSRLAREAGVSLGIVRQLEQGTVASPTVRIALALADALGVSIGDLVGERRPAGCRGPR